MEKKKFSLCPDVDITEYEEKKSEQNKVTESNNSNHLTGIISPYVMNNFNFNEQYYTYNSYGTSSFLIPDQGLSIYNSINNSKKYREELKKTREKYNNPGTGDFNGPWAKYKDQTMFKNISNGTELTDEQKEILAQLEEKRLKKIDDQKKMDEGYLNFKPETVYHLDQELDYKGRSFIEPPNDLKNTEHNCYIPKKLVHTYTGHTKPIQVIRFFPKYGHYLLSCSLDCKIKLWDVLSHRKCARTYIGHSEGVRDICFTNDGRQFLSAGFDKLVRLWDTETGKVIQTFPIKKIPFCVLFNPDEDKQKEFLVGTSVKKIFQYDINSNTQVQCYDEHLGAINTLTFIDNNRKFVSTSDDKKIFIWEYGLPVVVKHISEPSMYSIPAAVLHPNGKYFLGQSLDNKIVVYDCKNGFKINRKKKFIGHVNAGYSCGLDFSPDGQFLCSGDADGKLWFWDWRTTKNYTTINAHNKICNDVKWHPIKPSLLASCSWDNTIKLWDSR